MSKRGFPFAPSPQTAISRPTASSSSSQKKPGSKLGSSQLKTEAVAPKASGKGRRSESLTSAVAAARASAAKTTKAASPVASIAVPKHAIPREPIPVAHAVAVDVAPGVGQMQLARHADGAGTGGDVGVDGVAVMAFMGNISSSSSVPASVATSALVMVSQATVLYLSGFCKVTLLKGCANIHGYALTAGVTVSSIHVPCWCPAARLHAAGSKANKKEGSSTSSSSPSSSLSGSIFTLLKRINRYDSFAELAAKIDGKAHVVTHVLDTCECVLLLEGLPPQEQSWMVSAEDHSAYALASTSTSTSNSMQPVQAATYTEAQAPEIVALECMQVLPAVGGCVCVGTGMLGDQYAMMQRNIQVSYLPPTWSAVTNGILSDMKTRQSASRESASGIGNSGIFSPRILLCGAKGVGKSTCGRYTLNRLLSKHKAVCVLDCDVGQPEYSVPGMLSLTIVTRPNLSPPHLHLQQSDTSYFFGDVSTKSGPARLMASVELLMKRYSVLQKQFAAGDLSAIGISAVKTSSLGDNFNIFDSLKEKETFSLPLIINTDGNIRYMGSEILAGIVSITQPQYVLQLVTEKDRHLPALEQLDANIVHALELGSSVASPVSALDLRTLRLVSYFLGNNSLIKQHLRNPKSFKSLSVYGPAGAAGVAGAAPAASSGSSLGADEGGGIYIRSGTLVDKQGAIAATFAGLKPWVAPSSVVALGSLADDVPAHLLPALMNASLVGVCESENDQVLSLQINGSSEANRGNNNDEMIVAPAHVPALFNTRQELVGSAGHLAMTPCIGLGVVRSINLQQNQFYLLSPIDPNKGSKFCAGSADRPGLEGRSQRPAASPVALVRGSMVLPVALLFSPAFPCHPYLTSASAGDGAAQTRARNNVKRRIYQAP